VGVVWELPCPHPSFAAGSERSSCPSPVDSLPSPSPNFSPKTGAKICSLRPSVTELVQAGQAEGLEKKRRGLPKLHPYARSAIKLFRNLRSRNRSLPKIAYTSFTYGSRLWMLLWIGLSKSMSRRDCSPGSASPAHATHLESR